MDSNKKIRLLLFIPSLTSGGAERVMLFISQNLNKEKFAVKLIVIGFKYETIYDTSKVEVIYLNHKKVRAAFLKILKLFFVHRPHIVLGSLTHVNYNIALVSYLFPKIKCIARETFVLSEGKKFNNWDKKRFHSINRIVSNIAHRRIDSFICQSNDMRKDMESNIKYKDRNIITINNPVSDNIVLKDSIPDFKTIQFITVGRLVKQKGHQRIIEVLSELDLPYCYTIIGDGIEREHILAYAQEKNVLKKINYISQTKEVYKYLSRSHIYLQGSYVEGFPNALIESLAVGTPAIVYEAPGGMNEIIVNNENGFLVKDNEEFLEKLKYLLNNLTDFAPNKVCCHVKKNFSAKSIINKYEALFNNCV